MQYRNLGHTGVKVSAVGLGSWLTYGGSVALIVIGAILRFAISYSPANVNLQLIGVILMIAGAIGLIVSLVWMFGRRRRTVTTTRTPNTTEVYEERRYTEPPV